MAIESEQQQTEPLLQEQEDAQHEQEDRGDVVDPRLLDDERLGYAHAEDEGEAGALTDDAVDPDLLAELAGEAKPGAVPYARFQEVNEERKSEREARLRAEEALARMRGQQQDAEGVQGSEKNAPEPPAAYDFDAAEDRYTEALLEGNNAEAKQIRAQIRAEERRIAAEEAQQKAYQVVEHERQQLEGARQQHALQACISEIVSQYPALNVQGEAADQVLIDAVNATAMGYAQSGMAPADALRKAADGLMGRLARAAPPAAKGQMSPDQLARNMQRAEKIPQAMPGVGERQRDVDYSALSDDEWDRLPQQEKRAARGDFVRG